MKLLYVIVLAVLWGLTMGNFIADPFLMILSSGLGGFLIGMAASRM